MKQFAKILSLMLSCSIAGLSAVSPSVSAADNSCNFPVQYDSTKKGKSKDLNSGDKPFRVFDIYNAYYGITTTTTATTTTTTTTTKKTTTTTTTSTTTTKKTTAATTTKKTTAKKTTTTAKATTAKTTAPATTVVSTTFTTAVQTSGETTTGEVTTTTVTVPVPAPFCNGIDVSQYQGNIDWQAVKDSGVDFAILRAGYGKELYQVDPTFRQNIEGAKAAGIDVGIYWYSYADDSATAKREAEVCYETIKDYTLEYPVYFDIEEPKHANMSIAQTSVIVDTFCSEMENRGYYVGVYSYANFLQSHIYRSVLEKYDVWVAQYSENLTAYNGHYSVWQYSSKGEVNGIGGNVDMNHCYRDYSEIIESNPNPNFVPPETTATTAPVATETTTTTTATKVFCDIVNADTTMIDWDKYDKKTAMLTADSLNKKMFANNITIARLKNGIKSGFVWQTDKTTVEEITAEAEKLHEFIEDMKFEYPVYLDLTNSAIIDSALTNDEISELIRAFCSVLDADKKHYIALRGYDDFLTDRVNDDIYKDYDVWLVTDDDTIRFKHSYGMISRLTSGNGVSQYENECLRNYPAIMIEYHLNGF